MKLPNGDRAEVPEEKLVGYLLSTTHPVGREKARVLRAIGYTPAEAHALRDALLQIARNEEVRERIETDRGTKYVIDGTLEGPKGDRASFRNIWNVEIGSERPRFVTAYPSRREQKRQV